jgi:hypothetical protein
MNDYSTIQNRWLKLSLFSLLIVATIGVVLRYKIVFALPFINQKHLLHSHSHFAFSGWVSQTLMVLMVGYLSQTTLQNAYKKYNPILIANLVAAYAMLIAFALQGYGNVSVLFSTISICISFWFAWVYISDLKSNTINTLTASSFKVALVFNIISSLGAFALALMMINKVVHQNWYLAAEYYYLHFQYNGWFFFVCLGLVLQLINTQKTKITTLILKVFIVACVPTYFLSTLWMPLPLWLYIVIVIATIAQLFAGIRLLTICFPIIRENVALTKIGKKILLLSSIAFAIKLLLQAGSTIPELSDFAFGFRPIVIGYLHLVLLGVISLFILGYICAYYYIRITSLTKISLTIFIIGIIANELVLMLQGVAAISYNSIHYSNELLFGIAFLMFSGILLLNFTQKERK